MSTHGIYTTIDGRPAVRFERRLAHPPDAVWRMLTEPAELARWFPSAVEVDLRPGGAMRFEFAPDVVYDGEVLALDPPRALEFTWGADTLRFDLAPDGDGTRLTFLHVLREEGSDAAAKTAAGWHGCFDAMADRLAGGGGLSDDDGGPSPAWRARYDEYVAAGFPSGAPIPSS